MTSRRRRPEGVQYRRRSDGTIGYRVPWREGGVRDGAQRSRTFELVEQAVSFRGALVTNGYRDPYDDPEWVARLGLVAQPSTARTFEQAAREYLETLVDVTERTVAEYRRDLDTHVYPAVAVLPNGDTVGPFRRVMVDRFDTETVQAWVSLMRKKTHGGKAQRKYSPKTITNLHGSVIAPVFEFAIDRGYISSNPSRRVRLNRPGSDGGSQPWRMRVMAAPRRYSDELRGRATRMAVEARCDAATSVGAIKWIADQLGIHPEALRTWVKQVEIDGGTCPGTTSSDAERIAQNRELRRANEILKTSAAFFAAAELDRRIR